jgi:UPF0176 protein
VTRILNISAYRFTPLADPLAWRGRIRAQAERHSLRGTVLLAEEGINLFLAGDAPALRAFVEWLRGDPSLAAMHTKESWSPQAPFRKLLVKVKREIIRMNEPAITPTVARAPAVDAPTLARWLDRGHDDAGRPVVLLDTRNGFEVDHGRFRGAIDWRLARFSDFPQAMHAHGDALRGRTVVTYCTGGIRCEKAALYMARAGVQHVLQLDGGILAYFERVGGRHFDGRCFVFDERQTLGPALAAVA